MRFFYDERRIRRHSALPEPVVDTIFGQGAVHTLDGERHQVREESDGGHGLLVDRKAIATGGDSGIGRAVAVTVAREGADVLITRCRASLWCFPASS